MRRLAALAALPPSVARPGYEPSAHGVGILHLGLGAFHRAHQAVYTDRALAEAGGDWRIVGASLQSTAAADALNPQNGLYTVIERGPGGASARVVGSLARAISEPRSPGATLAAMTDPSVRIVSLTVTEKAYGLDRETGGVDPAHPAIARDLAAPRAPGGVTGLLVEALRLRREAGRPPPVVLCCDNLPRNGALLRGGVLDFARRIDPELAHWIDGEVSFPSTMVDRITPAPTGTTLADALRMTGCEDRAAVETEPFSQWAIERFEGPRPAWEAGGALFVADIAPFETMKLRMLNGAHSMLAYAGVLSGHDHVRDAMADPALARLVRRHLDAAAATLQPLPGVDFAAYAAELEARFANPAIAHETRQIAADGTEKLPQRIFAPALETLQSGGEIAPFAFAAAAWMRYCLGSLESGETYPLRDPREERIARVLDRVREPGEICAALLSLPGLCPEDLSGDAGWRRTVTERLARMLNRGVPAALAHEAAACR